MLPRIVTVNLDIPPPSESGTAVKTGPGKWESERAKASQSAKTGTDGERQSVGFTCQSGGPELWVPKIYHRLDPANISSRLLGNNFDGVGGNAVEIGRLAEYGGAGGHTHYVRLDSNVSDGNANAYELVRVTKKSFYLEGLKRLLEGTLTIGLNGGETKYSIESLMPDNLTQNADSNEMVKAIRALLTGTGDRNAAAASLGKMLNDAIITAGSKQLSNAYGIKIFDDMTPEYFLELFPATSSADDWADDFLNILVFWTGSTTGNHCVFQRDDYNDWNYENFSDINGRSNPNGLNSWTYAIGETPLILLNTLDPITLTPAFTNTKIVYAEKPFTDGKGWALPARKKQPLYYRYDFTDAFPQARAGEMCVQQANLSGLVASVSSAYQLTADETSTLSRELTAEFPASSGFVKVSLANPADIAARFRWLGDGEPLDILQLFFGFTPGGCAAESLTPPALDIPAGRDGFEVGVLE